MDEMDQFLKEYEIRQLSQYEADNLNSPVSVMEIKFMV